MNSYRFLVEIGHYEGSAWCSNTNSRFNTVVSASNPSQAQRMLEAQYGGSNGCRVIFQGYA